VAFLGGSITHNAGWRDLVAEDLQKRFPDVEFEFVNAGIPSMGSTPGAFRLRRDVFGHGAVDLLFVEAAVNDSTNDRSDLEQRRAMEGIVRAAKQLGVRSVVLLHFADPAKLATYGAGRTPAVIANHQAVAEHYGVVSLDLAREVFDRIAAGEFSWKDDFRDLHPSPFGQRVYAESIARLFDAAWPDREAGSIPPPSATPEPLDPYCYSAGRLVAPDAAEADAGWRLDPAWKPADGAGTRAGFVNVPMLVAESAGASLRLRFHGRGAGILVAAGPDAGFVEWRVDANAWQELDLFTRWSGGLHLPWAHVLEAELGPGAHVLELRVGEHRNEASRGRAVRIVNYLVNGDRDQEAAGG